MTPPVATYTTVATTTPLIVLSARVHDREWWAQEAVRAGTDWSGVVAAAFKMMVDGGLLEVRPQTFAARDAPWWHQAAAEYHRDRLGPLDVAIEPNRLARLRRLMADDVPLARAWHELRDKRSNF